MRPLSIPRFRAYLGATTALFGAGTPRRQDGLFPARLPTGTQAVCSDRRASASLAMVLRRVEGG
jgi:hypothetical protein